MNPQKIWNERLISVAFWGINIGCLAMMLLSLLPIGLMQTAESISNGYWSARSPEFLQTDIMQFWRWMRVFGDTIFALGAVAFVWFALGLIFGKKDKETT